MEDLVAFLKSNIEDEYKGYFVVRLILPSSMMRKILPPYCIPS